MDESQWDAQEGCGGAEMKAGRQAGLEQRSELPGDPDPEALTYILLLVLTQGIKLALNCIVCDISKY